MYFNIEAVYQISQEISMMMNDGVNGDKTGLTRPRRWPPAGPTNAL